MYADPLEAELRQRFQGLLNAALAKGVAPLGESGLGPRTTDAVAVVAGEHPEATAEHVVHAYDMFLTEHGTGPG
ncbi:hypothetical protein MINTM008_05170 [Mycobacterium intracellulare]|nr:hypothetical protein MINTM008_05170 [Mycobacterium intracellulare]BCO76733.1 hypothetical protein MINTM009_05150 [Mycobacterium intracellulare]BCP29547.1 hypothetical protein MINTM026_05170 [Mycobacterium intracellulare]BCP40423.1 hypothetical protein MINTMi27_05160 [Mycobacterium intracellulare]